MNRCYFLIIFCLLFFPVAVHAQCTMPDDRPDAEAGVIVFNTDHKVMQYCNGDDWVGLRGGGGGGSSGGTPAGAVMAFDLAACLDGWSEYLPARGRFIRGIDNGAGNDPAGTRAAGHVQEDAFQGHKHSFSRSLLAPEGYDSYYDYRSVSSHSYDANFYEGSTLMNPAPVTDGTNGVPRIANETRPKNIALLYCRKN